jgi:hypothetical protein
MRHSLPDKKFQAPLRTSEGQTNIPDKKNMTGMRATY